MISVGYIPIGKFLTTAPTPLTDALTGPQSIEKWENIWHLYIYEIEHVTNFVGALMCKFRVIKITNSDHPLDYIDTKTKF